MAVLLDWPLLTPSRSGGGGGGGIEPILLEADDHVGGRLGGENINGFITDKAADFFPESYDVTFQLCEELGLPLVRLDMVLGWYRNGRWVTTTPIVSFGTLLKNLRPFWTMEFISPRGFWPTMKLTKSIRDDAQYLNYASDHRIAELDTDETYGDYLDRLNIPDGVRVTLEGFLELTMGHVEQFGATWIRAFLGEVLLKPDKLFTPKGGCSALAEVLAEKCGDAVRVSTPVHRVIIENGEATGVITDGGRIDADAVICAVPATKALDIMPDLPPRIRSALKKVNYSQGIRVVVGLDQRPLPPGWGVALYPEDRTPALFDRTINLPECAPSGKSMLDLWVGKDRAAELFPLDDDEVTRKMLSDVHRNPPPGSAIPNEDDLIFTRVYRWKDAVCMGQPGMFTAMLEMRDHLKQDVKNLSIAGDYMRSPIVNGAVASGIETAEEVANMLASGCRVVSYPCESVARHCFGFSDATGYHSNSRQ